MCGGRSGALWLPSHHPGECCTLVVAEEIPPHNVKRFECLEKCYMNVRNYMGFRSGMSAGQSSTVISLSANHLEVVLALWAGGKVLLKKEISISIKLVSRWKHKVLQNLLVDGCIDFGLD